VNGEEGSVSFPFSPFPITHSLFFHIIFMNYWYAVDIGVRSQQTLRNPPHSCMMQAGKNAVAFFMPGRA
jgi:hypothetical protein